MLILAIDTATRYAGIALFDGKEALAEYTWQSGFQHTRHVAPMIERALQAAKVTSADLRAVAVTKGPGSFTGLRIGFALAKGFATSLDIPLVAIPTLDVTAFPHFYGHIPVRAVLRAGRGRYAFTTYRRETDDRWRSGELQLGDLETLSTDVEHPMRFVGELGASEQEQLRARLGELARFVPGPFNLRRASVLALLAYERLQRGESDEVTTAAPIYLQLPRQEAS